MTNGRRPVWQPLLFRQTCLLAGVTGMLACRFPAHGVLAAFLLALFTLPFPSPKPGKLSRHVPEKILLFALAFCAGLAFAHATAPGRLPPSGIPAWATAAVTPGGKHADARFSNGVLLTGIILENTALAGGRTRLLLENVRARGEEDPLPGSLVLSWRNPPPEIAAAGPGQTLTATLRLRHIRGFANPGTWNTEQYWHDRGAYFRAWANADASGSGKNAPYLLEGEALIQWRAREKLKTAVIAALATENGVSRHAAVILALLFGDRSFFAPETLDLVARSTLAHSLALSGMHLGFAAGIGYAAAYLLHFLFPSLFLRLPRQKAGLLLALPVCALYLWLGGAPPSLIRAFLMLLFWGILLWLHRPKVLLDGLIWVIAVILLVSPVSLFDIRLQLSAVSVAGIALVTPLIQSFSARSAPSAASHRSSRLKKILRRIGSGLAGMALVSIAAQLAVLPLVLDAFPGAGLWFPLNLIWLPVLGIWVMPLAFAGLGMAALGFSVPASALFALAELPCAGLFSLLQAMDAAGILLSPVALRPAFPAAAGYWLLLLLLPAVYTARTLGRRQFVLLCLSLVLAAGPSLYPATARGLDMVRLRLLDVGQGQSVAVSWKSGGHAGRILIDGGGFASPFFDVGREVVTPALTDNAAPDLEWIINSHADTDHLQGLLFPLETFRVRHVAFGPDFPDRERKTTVSTARRDAILARRSMTPARWRAGDRVTLAPGLALEVLHPGEGDRALSANNGAMVLRLVWRDTPLALICGDLERKGIASLLKRAPALEAAVLILPHHGSAGSCDPRLYDAVKPKLALAACGYANHWHFPAEKVRAALAERNIPLETTADRGQIAVVWEDGSPMRTAFARE